MAGLDEEIRERLIDHWTTHQIMEGMKASRDSLYEHLRKIAVEEDKRLFGRKVSEMALEMMVYDQNMQFILQTAKDLASDLSEHDNTKEGKKMLLDVLVFMRSTEQERITSKAQMIQHVIFLKQALKRKSDGTQMGLPDTQFTTDKRAGLG